MSVTRQWMLILILTAAISVAVHSLVLSTLINRYYISYSTDSYHEHVSQLADFSEKVLTETSYSETQLEMHFETHLSDSIYRIRLYNAEGHLLVDVQADNIQTPEIMSRGMMHNMMGDLTEETDAIDIANDNGIVGQLLITKISSFGNTMASRMFTVSLIGNSLISFVLVFILIFIIGIYASRKMSRDLKLTARQAIDIGVENKQISVTSRIWEIRTIQQSLEELQTRLKLRQTSRKKLVDELIHQTRTPLTILKTHLEGLSDGVLQLTPEEIKTWEVQIENLTIMITNISNMIDADKDIEQVHIEPIELRQMLKQITDGLLIQFDKKNIRVNFPERSKIEFNTDRYKLSQAIYNILTNAYKFSAPDGLVTIDYKRVEDRVIISIQDNGQGICEAEKTKIFDAYYRGSNAEEAAGEGIGLYIAQENLQKIGGWISVESQSGVGSKFNINLPVTPANPDGEKQPDA